MKDNLTEIIFILDRSGSMYELVDDTIGGFNALIEEQKIAKGEAKLTTILFDDYYEVLHSAVDIKEVNPITRKEYFARGGTALLDAIGKTINEVGARLANTPEEDRPEKVIFAITTDGQENSSREFGKAQIKEMITRQTEEYNWQFLFLGANIDAIGEASALGISGAFAANYSANDIGTRSIYMSMSAGIQGLRGDPGPMGAVGASGVRKGLDEDWKKHIK